MSRNIIFSVNDGLFFWNGQTALQQTDTLTYETGLLYQKVVRTNSRFEISTTSYIPLDTNTELHEIRFTNISNHSFTLGVTTAIPMYCRSADNLRDHRHVTSLLNRIETVDHGILVTPTLSFDERGHKENEFVYSVFADSKDLKVKGYIPVLDDFIDGGSLHFPQGLNRISPLGTKADGYEALGGIAFESILLSPKQSITLYVSIGIHDSATLATTEGRARLNELAFSEGLSESARYFTDYCNGLTFNLASDALSNRLNWIVLQPLIRRLYGNSFLPHHDYGRGGRGWRDLWQDLLSLILMEDPDVPNLLLNNFQGIRIDGSNATIIGEIPGEFKADRNQITRVWSDHGAWPLWTVKMYVDETGDFDFLLRTQPYFMDQFTHYTHSTRQKPLSDRQTDRFGKVYQGSVLEHLLLQNLVGHHHIGEHGFVKLEDADWNDGLDMASKRGETISFTHMYARNLLIMASLIRQLPVDTVEIFSELQCLLSDHTDLSAFFDRVAAFSGETVRISKDELATKLERLGHDRIAFLQKKAFDHGRFQSYYDNNGILLDDDSQICLTGQAMALLNGTATPDQAQSIAKTTREQLFSADLGGYRLNSNHHDLLMNMGRAFGFAYGHKENGAVFSHMAVMYAYGLYQYNMALVGREAVWALLEQAEKPLAKVWVGIPEYFTDRGEGKYSYLTGSASWILHLLRTKVFGVVFHGGELQLDPHLTTADFINQKASIRTRLFGKTRSITYYNLHNLEYGSYRIARILVNGVPKSNPLCELDGDIEVYLDELL